MLAGAPQQPFRQRASQQWRSAAAALDLLALGTCAWLGTALGRWPLAPPASLPAGHLALAACAAAAASSLALRWRAGASPSCTALNWQEALSLLLCLGTLGCEASLGVWQALGTGGDASEPSAADGGGGPLPGAALWLVALPAHVLHLLAASSTICMMLQSLRPMRISLRIAAHTLMLLAFSRRAAGVCAAPLAAPGGRALTRRVFGLLRPLGFLAPIPASPLVELDAAGECRAVLWFLQAALGVVAPLARRAIVESRLFALHQAQRAAAGLPPERGASAAILSAVQDLLHDTIRPHLCIFAVVLTGSLWDWACTLASRAALLDTAGT